MLIWLLNLHFYTNYKVFNYNLLQLKSNSWIVSHKHLNGYLLSLASDLVLQVAAAGKSKLFISSLQQLRCVSLLRLHRTCGAFIFISVLAPLSCFSHFNLWATLKIVVFFPADLGSSLNGMISKWAKTNKNKILISKRHIKISHRDSTAF